MESDDERERKAAKKANKKVKSEATSGDEGIEPKRKRVRKGRKNNGAIEGSDADEDALFTGDEADKPTKKVGHLRQYQTRLCSASISSDRRNASFETTMRKRRSTQHLVKNNSKCLHNMYQLPCQRDVLIFTARVKR